MNYKPDESTLVSYLYGELDEKENVKVELYLLEHPEARMELLRMNEAREMVRVLGDKEVIAPPIFVETPSGIYSLWKSTYFRRVTGIAAAILLLMVAGRLMSTEIRYANGELAISLGRKNEVQPSPLSLTPEQVQGMINASLNQNNVSMEATMADQQKKIDASIQRQLAVSSKKMNDIMSTASLASQQQVRAFVGGLQDENLRLMKDYLQLSSHEQKKYVESLLVDFSKYLEEQRNQDLDLFQTKLNSMENNTNQFKQETESLLSSIISNGSPKKENSY